jgi:chemotaxis methyl-accepting protein methylase
VTGPLEEVAALVLRESGMVIRASQLPALEAAIRRVEPGMTAEGLLRELARPGLRESLVGRLIDEVTIKETFFLRHREELEAIDWKGLAARAMNAGRTSVRVWSAACASGEEPYSLAMLALESFAPGPAPVDVLATDIASTSIARARQGHYGARSVRHVDAPLRERWFTEDPGGLAVGDAVRGLVRFAQHNLLSDPIPPLGEAPFDLVVCRNVLIYFETDAVRETIRRLQAALVPGGVLILGAADRLTGGPEAPPLREEPQRPDRRRPAPRSRAGAQERRQARRDRRVVPPPAPAVPPAGGTDAAAEVERGSAALAAGEVAVAVDALRKALYLDPAHAPAAFLLARAHEARGDATAARRSYFQALALLEDAPEEVGGVARRDLEAAARARLAALAGG